MERELKVLCAGKTIPLNDFTRKLVLNVILGLARSLSGVDADEAISIQIGSKESSIGAGTRIC